MALTSGSVIPVAHALDNAEVVSPASSRSQVVAASSLRAKKIYTGERNDLNLETILWIPSAPPARTSAVMMASVIRNMSS